MKRWMYMVGMLAMCLSASAQGVYYSSSVTTAAKNVPPGAQAPLYSVPYAKVTICSAPATPSGTVCTNTVPVYSDVYLSQPITQPVLADSLGNFGFYVSPGNYSYSVQNPAGSYLVTYPFTASGVSVFPGRTVYASQMVGVTAVSSVQPGTNATGMTDSHAAIQAAIASGAVNLVIDLPTASSAAYTVSSNTRISCINGGGIIMLPGANSEMFLNAHPNAPTTTSGTGYGYLPSNITDTNIDVGVGCMFNMNATQSITSSDHKTSPITGKWLFGFRLLGLKNSIFHGFTTYDTGAYSFAIANHQYVTVRDAKILQPQPLVTGKNTDGIHVNMGDHFTGENLDIIAGDDPVAFNADDGFESRFGDGNYSSVNYTGWAGGPITDSHFSHIRCIECNTTGRMLSVTELIDNDYVDDLSGKVQGTFNFYHEYTAGMGNYGTNRLSNFNVKREAGFTFRPAKFFIGANYNSLTIDGTKQDSPLVSENVVGIVDGTPGLTNIINTSITTPAGSVMPPGLISYAVPPKSLNINGFTWIDGTGQAYAVCTNNFAIIPYLNITGYNGPANRQFCPTFASGSLTGDGLITTYIATAFNESTAGNITSTSPMIDVSGDTWHGVTGSDGVAAFQYSANGAMVSTNSQLAYINAGAKDYVLRAVQTSPQLVAGFQFIVRYTNPSNYVYVDFTDGGMALVDVEAGTATTLQTVAGNFSGTLLTVTVLGAQITAVAQPRIVGSATTKPYIVSGTLPSNSANLTATNVGFEQNVNTTAAIAAFSVASR